MSKIHFWREDETLGYFNTSGRLIFPTFLRTGVLSCLAVFEATKQLFFTCLCYIHSVLIGLVIFGLETFLFCVSLMWPFWLISQPAITCSKLTRETEQVVKYVQN